MNGVKAIRFSDDLWRKVMQLARKAKKTASAIVREAVKHKVESETKP